MYTKPERESRLYWEGLAPKYDDHQLNGYYKTLIDRLLSDIGPSKMVLDVAAGTGMVALVLSKKAANVEAIDFSPQMIQTASKAATAKHIDNVRFSVQSAYDLKFPGSIFDIVLICNSLHVMQQPGRALAEAKRVLKRSGMLIAPTACLGETEEVLAKSRAMVEMGFPAYHFFSSDSLCRLIESAGFKLTEREPIAYKMPMAYVSARKRGPSLRA
jgi:ubiquinone/menaquinone biosynthesis C-methylase UbiE